LSSLDRHVAGRFPVVREVVAMKTPMAALALVVGMFVYVPLRADDGEKTDGKVKVILIERVQDLNLTDDKETKIQAIRKEFRPKVQAAGKALSGLIKDEVEKIEEVLTAEQKEKLKEMKDARADRREKYVAHAIARLKDMELTDAEMTKIGAIRKEYRPKIEKTMKELHGLLTDEQKKARADALKAGKKGREVLAAIKFTDDQKKKVSAIFKEVGTLVWEEVDKIREVLSEEQKAKLAEIKEERKERIRDRRAHMIANLKDLDLKDDQKTKITAIRKEYRPKVHEAGNKLRATLREEMKAVMEVLKG
jgi:Spy/CpxP family protein refolding chaperone